MVLVDEYGPTNQDGTIGLKDHHPSDSTLFSASGQVFQVTGGKHKITSCELHLKKVGSPTGTGYAKLYAITGTPGTDAKPTGSALATSDGFDVSTLSTALTMVTFTFTGAQQYEMQDNTWYAIVFENPATGTIDANNKIVCGRDKSSPTHGGNTFQYSNGAWTAVSDKDGIFSVYGDLVGNIKTYSIDVLLKKVGITKTYSSDLIIGTPSTPSPSPAFYGQMIYGLFKYGQSGLTSRTKDYPVYIYLKKLGIPLSYGVDAVLQKTLSLTYNADAILQKNVLLTYDADLIMSKTVEHDYVLALALKKQVTKTYSADLILSGVTTRTLVYNADAFLKKLGIAVTYDADVTIQKQGIPVNYLVDLILGRTGLLKTYNADTVLKGTITKGYDTDLILKKLQITKSYSSDLILGTVTQTRTVSYFVDFVLKKEAVAVTYSADLFLRPLKSVVYSADLVLKRLGITLTYTSELVLKKTAITKTYSTDLVLNKTTALNYPADAILKKPAIPKTYESDIVLFKANVTKTYTADLILVTLVPHQPFYLPARLRVKRSTP